LIRIDASKITKDLLAIKKASRDLHDLLVGEETMMAIAVQGITVIKRRTAQSKDADGASFAKYSEGYEKAKIKKGRSATPDLRGFGRNPRMMENIHARYDGPRKATILFTNSEQANKAAGNMKKREFFDIRLPEEIAALTRKLNQRVDAAIIKLRLG